MPIESSSHKEKGRFLGLGWMLVGAAFLFEPFVGMWDFLPDAIGYFLVAIGLARAADLDDRLAEAARGFRRLSLIGLIRLVAFPIAFGIVAPSEQPAFLLLMLFSLGVLDVILLFPSWNSLAGGFNYLALRQNGTEILRRRVPKAGRPEDSRSRTDHYVRQSLGFFIAREVLVVLPECAVLSVTDRGNGIYQFVGLFREIGMMLSLVFGIIWLISTIRLARRVAGDRVFFENLKARYEAEVLSKPQLLAARAVRRSLAALCVGVCFSANFYFNHISFLPDAVAAVLWLLSFLLLYRYLTRVVMERRMKYITLAVAAVYVPLSAVTWYVQSAVLTVDDAVGSLHHAEVYEKWGRVFGLTALSLLVGTLAFALIVRALYHLVRMHLGRHMPGAAGAVEDADDPNRYEASVHRRLRRRLIACVVWFMVGAFSTLFHWGGIPLLAEMPLNMVEMPAALEMLIVWFEEAYWMVDVALHAGLIIQCFSTAREIREQMAYSYMLTE